MTQLVLPSTLVPGMIEDVAPINENLEAVRSVLNAGLDAQNFADGSLTPDAFASTEAGYWRNLVDFNVSAIGQGNLSATWLARAGDGLLQDAAANTSGVLAQLWFPDLAHFTCPGRLPEFRAVLIALANDRGSVNLQFGLGRVTGSLGSGAGPRMYYSFAAGRTLALETGALAPNGSSYQVSAPLAASALVEAPYALLCDRLSGNDWSTSDTTAVTYSIQGRFV